MYPIHGYAPGVMRQPALALKTVASALDLPGGSWSNLAMRRAMRHRVPRRLSKTDLVAQMGASEGNLEEFASVSFAPGYAPYIYIYRISALKIFLCAAIGAIYIYIYMAKTRRR